MLEFIYNQHYLVLAVLFAVPILLYILAGRKRKKKIQHVRCVNSRLPFQRLFGDIPGKTNRRLSFVLVAVLCITGYLSWVGLQRSSTVEYEERAGADVCLLLDITYSMQAPVDPGASISRMKRMKHISNSVIDYLESQQNDNRLALIAFGWLTQRLTPFPTDDFRIVRRELDGRIDISFSWLHGRLGSNIAAGFADCMKLFKEIPEKQQREKKIVIAITDGEPFGNYSRIHDEIAKIIGSYSEQEDIALILIGVGNPDEKVRIPKYDLAGNKIGYEFDDSGSPVTTRSDFAFLEKIARSGRGRFIAHQTSEAELKKLIEESLADAQKTGRIKTKKIEANLTSYLLIAYTLSLIGLMILNKE